MHVDDLNSPGDTVECDRRVGCTAKSCCKDPNLDCLDGFHGECTNSDWKVTWREIRLLGSWWVDAALAGDVDRIPVANPP